MRIGLFADRYRRALAAILVATQFALCANTARADLTSVVHFNIAQQPLATAMIQYAQQSGVQVSSSSDLLDGRATAGLNGSYAASEALRRLLAGTDLVFDVVDSNTIAIRLSVKSKPTSSTTAVGEQDDPVRLAQAERESPADVSTGAQSSPTSSENQPRLQEVIVTAQKKSERLQDVPIPLTVIDTEALANSGAGRLQDYYATVPGLSLLGTPFGGATQYVTLRGLSTTNGGAPTVAMVIDDVPFGLPTGASNGSFDFQDIDPSDLARIEVLKGPQGTLYGADSLGGLIKIVTQDPSTDALSGRVQVLGEGVSNGGAGYSVRGALNVPLSDTLAVRASGFTRRDPGYIDNVTTGQDNINSANTYGGRLGTLWHPFDGLSLKFGALFQTTQGFGNAQINSNRQLGPVLGDLQQTGLPNTGRYTSQVQLYTATLNAKFAGLNFVSVSGFGINKYSNSVDYSALAGVFNPPLFPTATGASVTQFFEDRQFSQELRLSGSLGARWDWLVGTFYTRSRAPLLQNINANDGTTGAQLGTTFALGLPLTFYESATFGDLTLHVTDQFDVQVGAREGWNHQIEGRSVGGVAQADTRANGTAFTYLASPQYKVSRDVMVYARVASGYRIGGPNFNYTVAPYIPKNVDADKTTDYDLGIKAIALDRMLTVDASAYYINWRDVQVGAARGGFFFEINGGSAKSEGVELAVQLHPREGTTVALDGSVGTAELTQDLPHGGPAYGLSGDRLPYSIRTSGTFTIDQDIFHISDTTGSIGASATYIAARKGEFQGDAATARLVFPSYTTVNVHVGVTHQRWLFNLFANNVGDRRGIIGGDASQSINDPAGYYAYVIQPRTVGLSIAKTF